jgi:hypothetical protein
MDRYEERLGDFGILQYNYFYVGLPALDEEEYLQRPGVLAAALAAAMRVLPDRRPEIRAESLAQVVQSPENDYRKFLLTEFVEAYLPLKRPEEVERYNLLLQSDEFGEVRKMAITTFEKGLEAGLRKALIQVMQTRFGPVPSEMIERIERSTEEQLSQLIKRVSMAESLAEIKIDEILE